MLERLLEEPEEVIQEELDERSLETSEDNVETLAEKYEEKISRISEGIEEELQQDLELISNSDSVQETGNGHSDDPLNTYEERGVERVVQNGTEVKITGQNTEIHPEAVVIVEKSGELPDNVPELSYQQRYQARKSLEKQGLLQDEELVRKPEEMIDRIKKHIENNIDTRYRNEEVKEPESTEERIDYKFQDDLLLIERGDCKYEVKARENGNPTEKLEMLGFMAGLDDDLVARYYDSDTDSRYLSEKYFQAFSELKDKGLASGGDVDGFNLEIEIPEDMAEDLEQELQRSYPTEQEKYTGEAIGIEDGSIKVKYEDGIAFVPEYDTLPQLGTDVKFIKTHTEDGVVMGELAT